MAYIKGNFTSNIEINYPECNKNDILINNMHTTANLKHIKPIDFSLEAVEEIMKSAKTNRPKGFIIIPEGEYLNVYEFYSDNLKALMTLGVNSGMLKPV